ncbi:MAG: glycoside hydrolase N-terminal domain-containing protein [Anaerovoracaceae bacterium]
MNNIFNYCKILAISLFSLIAGTAMSQINSPERGFISSKPGTTWEEGLISGNGTIGVNAFGNPLEETIIFTHERMFLPQGAPTVTKDQSAHLFEIRRLIDQGLYKEAAELQFKLSGQNDFMYPDPFVPVCDMNITMTSCDKVKDYVRSVNFQNGESLVYWKDDKGSYERRIFVSRADGIAVMKIKSSEKGALNCDVRFNRRTLSNKLPYKYLEGSYVATSESIKEVKIEASDDFLFYKHNFTKSYPGSIQSIEGAALVQVKGGIKTNNGTYISISNADEVIVLIDIQPIYQNGISKFNESKLRLSSFTDDYDKLLECHAKIHGELFNRVKLDLDGKKDANLTTEELFNLSTNDNINTALLEKEFDAGRYNIISCTGELPPVLQGLWAGTYVPDWASDYTHNGNVPSAIACTLMGNTPELMLAYTKYIEFLVPWLEINAKNLFGCRGIVLPSRSTTNGYNNALVGDFAGGFWIAGAAWAAHFFYDYYLYTGDKTFLKNHALPFMEKAGLFFEDFLYTGPDGKYVFSPTQSPENTPSNTNSQGTFNATMDVAAAKELFTNLIAASQELKVNTQKVGLWKSMLNKMPEYMIDQNGMFKEWLTSKLENNDAHRHSSQLYPLYDTAPVELTSNKEMVEAIRKSVNYKLEKHWKGKGYGFMSFGIVQLGLVGAAIGDKEIVHESLKHMVNRFWLSNMASMHNHKSLFNMDISGGMPAVIIKMLVYSDPGIIKLLPALPDIWSKGEICGVLCRGNIEIESLKWNGNDVQVRLISKMNQNVTIECVKNKKSVNLKANEIYTFNFVR